MNPAIRPAISRAAEVIAAAERLAVTCHVHPDGDALGSALGFAGAARAAGMSAVVSFPSPFVVPAGYAFLDTDALVPPEEFPERPDVAVVFDVAASDRLGELAERVAAARQVVVVDHHITNDGFGDVEVIDPGAAASAVLAYHLIMELGWPLDARTGTALLAGIVTDTGRFQYSSTDAATLRVAAELLELGVRPEVIGQSVYESVPFGYLQASAAVLGRATLDRDHGLVWSVLYDDDVAAADVDRSDLDGLIDDLRIAREAGVAALLKQVPGGYKVSLRSRGTVDVGAIAARHGGGGHHNASGFTATGTVAEIVGRVRSALEAGR